MSEALDKAQRDAAQTSQRAAQVIDALSNLVGGSRQRSKERSQKEGESVEDTGVLDPESLKPIAQIPSIIVEGHETIMSKERPDILETMNALLNKLPAGDLRRKELLEEYRPKFEMVADRQKLQGLLVELQKVVNG